LECFINSCFYNVFAAQVGEIADWLEVAKMRSSLTGNLLGECLAPRVCYVMPTSFLTRDF